MFEDIPVLMKVFLFSFAFKHSKTFLKIFRAFLKIVHYSKAFLKIFDFIITFAYTLCVDLRNWTFTVSQLLQICA